MPPSNDINGSTAPTHGRKKSARVVPAIPLALSKPRPTHLKRLPKTDATFGSEEASSRTTAVAAENGDIERRELVIRASTPTVSGGDGSSEDLYGAQEAVSVKNETMREHVVQTPASRGSAVVPSTNDVPPVLPPSESNPSTFHLAKAMDPVDGPTTSNTRLQSDKVEIRSTRAELPPAFIPYSEQGPSQSTPSSRGPVHMHPHMHTSQLSTSSLVFGGQDSTASSPAPPHSAGSAFQPPSYPPFAGAQPPPFNPAGHAHHTSETYAQQRPLYRGHGPPNSAWNMRQGYHPHVSQPSFHQQHTHQQFRYPPREVFHPAARQPNGHYSRSRSASQTSSAALKAPEDLQSPTVVEIPNEPAMTISAEPHAFFPSAPPHLRHHHPGHPMQPPSPMPHLDVASGLENAEALRDHVQNHFANPVLADCHLQIREEHDGSRQYLDAHRLILSRSETLYNLVRNSKPPVSAALKLQINIGLSGRYVRTRPFMESIRFLYGGPLPSLYQSRLSHGGVESAITNEERMEVALEHIATGAWLKLPIIAVRGVDFAINLLHWDTMPCLLPFALDGGLSQVWTVDDGSEDKISCSSSDDSLSRSDGISAPTYDPFSTQLLHRIIDFTVHMLPPNFYLDASAPHLNNCSRLPSLPPVHGNRASRSDPRLTKIRFGEIPVDDHQRPSIVTTTISSMLLSIPFALLKCIVEHDVLAARLGADTVASIMRQVIAEREVRRRRVLKAQPAGRAEDGAEAHLMQNLFWEEAVEVSVHHRAGLRLARRRRGIDTPPSSGAASEGSAVHKG